MVEMKHCLLGLLSHLHGPPLSLRKHCLFCRRRIGCLVLFLQLPDSLLTLKHQISPLYRGFFFGHLVGMCHDSCPPPPCCCLSLAWSERWILRQLVFLCDWNVAERWWVQCYHWTFSKLILIQQLWTEIIWAALLLYNHTTIIMLHVRINSYNICKHSFTINQPIGPQLIHRNNNQ